MDFGSVSGRYRLSCSNLKELITGVLSHPPPSPMSGGEDGGVVPSHQKRKLMESSRETHD